jgi:hypothetical protein
MLSKLPPMPRLEFEVGCLVPLALMLGVAIAVGVLVGMHLQPAASGPTQAVVRVIDTGAPGGPQVVSTQVVSLR